MKFLSTIRFDPSDTHVFEHAANENEWAISGGFWFSGITRDHLKGKLKQAFSNGFLSLESFGFSTFVSVRQISKEELTGLTEKFTQKLISDFGAPSPAEALTMAQEEIDDIATMCSKVPVNRVFGIKRTLNENNEIHETFRLIEPSDMHSSTRIWEIVDE